MTADEYVPHRYSPTRPELDCVHEAIRLFRQIITDGDARDVDVRFIQGYCEGVACAMVELQHLAQSTLGLVDDGGPADSVLWSETAVLHPWHRSDRYALKRVWFEYIRTAAEHIELAAAHVS